MSITRLEYLFHRYLKKNVTREETLELMQLVQQSAHDAAIKELLDGVWNDLSVENKLSPEKADVLFTNILASDTTDEQRKQRPVRTLFTLSRMVAAAVIVLLITAGVYYFILPHPTTQTSNNSPYKNDISPGTNGAMLTLSNGAQIQLDSAGNGNIAHEGNTNIIKIDSQLSYQVEPGTNPANLYNTVSTANGNQYQLKLPDGSNVWLNAGSSIRFPVSFSGNERRVTITGEVYFDVKHNSRLPFIVMVNDFEIHDLGTRFNVNAYADEAAVRTTLIEGKVSIGQDGSTILKPGQQAILSRSSKKSQPIPVQTVDVTAVTAWKDGLFMFDDNNIQAVMRQLERWYNIEVVYAGNVTKEEFVGTISRFENISQVLKMLERTGTVKFAIEGKRVTVK
jgi:ferric-dicitrate binding protein FerR (iron transport regulator)